MSFNHKLFIAGFLFLYLTHPCPSRRPHSHTSVHTHPSYTIAQWTVHLISYSRWFCEILLKHLDLTAHNAFMEINLNFFLVVSFRIVCFLLLLKRVNVAECQCEQIDKNNILICVSLRECAFAPLYWAKLNDVDSCIRAHAYTQTDTPEPAKRESRQFRFNFVCCRWHFDPFDDFKIAIVFV